jgi:CheY-like chemotaxis protein
MPLCVLVDDHDDTREGFAEYLQVNGFDVLSANGAEEFERVVESEAPDAIVLDLQLPDVNGWELASRIRANPRLCEVPLVAFSACVMPTERERASQAGFDLFLGKPCDPEIILGELRRLLREKVAK